MKRTLEVCDWSLKLVKLEFPLYGFTIDVKAKSQRMQKYDCRHKA